MARDIGFTITVKGTEQDLKKIGLIDQALVKLAIQRTKLLKKVKEGIVLSKEEQVAIGKLTTESKKLQAQKSRTLAQIKTENDLVRSTAGSYNRLVLENKKLTDAARKLSDPLGKNRKRFQELSVKITTNTDKLKKMDAAMGRSFRNVGNYSGAIGRLRGGFVAMGAAIAAGIIAFRTFARFAGRTLDIVIDFDQAVADLGSILGKTSDEMQILTEDAQRLGSSTKFTATEVAKLQKEFAKLGFSEKEILNATEATLSLASATNTELNEAAKIVGATVRGFNLDAAETQRVVDVMAKSFSSSALDMAKFQVAMAKVAPVAKAVGLDIEETTGIMGGLADAGLEASIIGTSLRRIFIELSAKGLTLDEALGRITNSQNRLNTAEELFGTRAATAALVMAENSEKAKELTEELRNAGGTAQTMAETQLDTLQGALTILKSAWEGFILGLESGRGVLGKTLRGIIDFTTGILNAFTPARSLTSQFLDMRKEFEKNEKETDNLVRRYNELIGTTEDNEEGQKELETVIRRLAKLVPEAVTEFDKYGRALDINTGKVLENSEQQRRILEFTNKEAIEEVSEAITKNSRTIDENREKLKRRTVEIRISNKVTKDIALSGEALQELATEVEALQKANAEAIIELQTLGVVLNEDQEALLANARAAGLLKEEIKELGNTEEELAEEKRKREEEAAALSKKEKETLAKQVEKNNATLLALNRELLEETIKLNSEGFAQEQSLLEAQHTQEIEDLQARKGETAEIDKALDALIKSRKKSQEAEITAIEQEGIDDRNNQKFLALELEQQEKLTEVAKSEDTEKEKQQAILDIQIEFAEKQLTLLEETADLTDEQVRLEAERIRTLLAELKGEAIFRSGGLSGGLAGFLNITEEDAQFLRDRALQLAKQINDGIFDLQRQALARSTKDRIESINSQAKDELKILQDRFDKGLISEVEFDRQSAQIEENADKRQENAERDAFKRGKTLSIVQALINGALAITKILAQTGVLAPFAIPAAIAATAVHVGFIAAQKFKEGGELAGPSHEQGGIKAGGVEFEGGEGVINKRSMRSGDVLNVSGTPRQIASQINAYKGYGMPFGDGVRRKFQLGGVAPDPNIAPGGVSANGVLASGPTFEETAELIAGALNAQVVEVVETDITDTQNDVSVIEELQN